MPFSRPVNEVDRRFTEIRQTFPALADCTFLDAACVSIISQPVYDAVRAFLDMCMKPQSVDASEHHIAMDRRRQHAVIEAARLIQAQASEIALVESTTHGLNLVAAAIPLQKGDRVLIPDTEFIQVALPWNIKAREIGIEIVPVPHRQGGVLQVEDFERRMDSRTRVVCVSSVQWCSGWRLDLATLSELCRSRGVYLVVDAIQELGACPVNVRQTPVDFLVAGGHKWLNAPFGCGLLYISEEVLDRLHPPPHGYLALEDPPGGWGTYFRTPDITPFGEFHPKRTAARFETAGTANYPGAIGLAASLRQIKDLGIEAIYQHIFRLTERLRYGLESLGARVITPPEPESSRSGITVFRYYQDPERDLQLMQKLLEEKIFVATRYTARVGGIRVSTHFYNNEEDIDRLCDAVRRATR